MYACILPLWDLLVLVLMLLLPLGCEWWGWCAMLGGRTYSISGMKSSPSLTLQPSIWCDLLVKALLALSVVQDAPLKQTSALGPDQPRPAGHGVTQHHHQET